MAKVDPTKTPTGMTIAEQPVTLNSNTGEFSVQIGTELITKSSMQQLRSTVERMNRGVQAIVVGRRIRTVKITGRMDDKLRLATGGNVSAKTGTILAHDPEVLKSLVEIEARQNKAEEEYNKQMAEIETAKEAILANAARFDPETVKETTAAEDAAAGDGTPDDDDAPDA